MVFGISPHASHVTFRRLCVCVRIFHIAQMDHDGTRLRRVPFASIGRSSWFSWAGRVQLANPVSVSIQQPLDLGVGRPVGTQCLAQRSLDDRVAVSDRVDGDEARFFSRRDFLPNSRQVGDYRLTKKI